MRDESEDQATEASAEDLRYISVLYVDFEQILHDAYGVGSDRSRSYERRAHIADRIAVTEQRIFALLGKIHTLATCELPKKKFVASASVPKNWEDILRANWSNLVRYGQLLGLDPDPKLRAYIYKVVVLLEKTRAPKGHPRELCEFVVLRGPPSNMQIAERQKQSGGRGRYGDEAMTILCDVLRETHKSNPGSTYEELLPEIKVRLAQDRTRVYRQAEKILDEERKLTESDRSLNKILGNWASRSRTTKRK